MRIRISQTTPVPTITLLNNSGVEVTLPAVEIPHGCTEDSGCSHWEWAEWVEYDLPQLSSFTITDTVTYVGGSES